MTKPKVGKWYYVSWIDAVGSVSGDPMAATAIVRQFMGRYTCDTKTKHGARTLLSYVFASGVDEGAQTEVGYTVIPVALLTNVEPVPQPKSQLSKEVTHGK
jgi:hypothetical protein